MTGQKGHTWCNQRRSRLVGLLVGGRSRVVSTAIKKYRLRSLLHRAWVPAGGRQCFFSSKYTTPSAKTKHRPTKRGSGGGGGCCQNSLLFLRGRFKCVRWRGSNSTISAKTAFAHSTGKTVSAREMLIRSPIGGSVDALPTQYADTLSTTLPYGWTTRNLYRVPSITTATDCVVGPSPPPSPVPTDRTL